MLNHNTSELNFPCPGCHRPIPQSAHEDGETNCPWCSLRIRKSESPKRPKLSVIRKVGIKSTHRIHLPEEIDEKIATERIQRILFYGHGQ